MKTIDRIPKSHLIVAMLRSWIIFLAVYSVSFNRYSVKVANNYFTQKISDAALNEECLKKFEESDPRKCGAVMSAASQKDVADDCTQKFPKRVCDIFSCVF